MKLVIVFLLLFLSLSSCKPCYNCEATDNTTGAIVDTETLCGNNEADDYEYVWTDSDFTGNCN